MNTELLEILTHLMKISTHFKCRGGLYPRSSIERFPVPDDKVSWLSGFKEYKPPNHTASSIRGQSWADPNIGDPGFKPQWNHVDGNVNRTSYMGYHKMEHGYPLNVIGRTGISGRGVLGRWGPNHAADPLVSRWKRVESGAIEKDKITKKPILQFVAVKRRDTGEWALPGGMVDPGEKVSATAVREFLEEATNSQTISEIQFILEKSPDERKAWFQSIQKIFMEGKVVFKGYIDDHRNTDNAWLESIAYNYHDNNGSLVSAFKLQAGDDVAGVRWMDASPDMKLHSTHKEIVMDVLNKHIYE